MLIGFDYDRVVFMSSWRSDNTCIEIPKDEAGIWEAFINAFLRWK